MKKATFRPNGLSRDRLGGPPTGVTAFDVIQKKNKTPNLNPVNPPDPTAELQDV